MRPRKGADSEAVDANLYGRNLGRNVEMRAAGSGTAYPVRYVTRKPRVLPVLGAPTPHSRQGAAPEHAPRGTQHAWAEQERDAPLLSRSMI